VSFCFGLVCFAGLDTTNFYLLVLRLIKSLIIQLKTLKIYAVFCAIPSKRFVLLFIDHAGNIRYRKNKWINPLDKIYHNFGVTFFQLVFSFGHATGFQF